MSGKRTKKTYRPNRGVRRPVRIERTSHKTGRLLVDGDVVDIADYRRHRNRRRDRFSRLAKQKKVVRGL